VAGLRRSSAPFHCDRPTKTEVNTLGAEHFTFGAGTDITELLHGLDGDARQSLHWGYVVQGAITADEHRHTHVAGAILVLGDRADRPPAHIKPGPPLAIISDQRPPTPATATA